MGYYTRYTAKVTGPEEELKAFTNLANLEDPNEYWSDDFGMPRNFWLDGNSENYDEMKWYGWTEDVATLSKLHPELTFHLEGEGEESGDMWKAACKNGVVKTVKAVVSFPDIDLDF